MSGQGKAGTWRDWPVAVIVVAALLALVTGGHVFAVVLFWAGVLALLIRRGLFTPRR